MREEQHRRQQFTEGRVCTRLPTSVMGGQQGSLLIQEHEQSNSVSIDLGSTEQQQLLTQVAMRDDTVRFNYFY